MSENRHGGAPTAPERSALTDMRDHWPLYLYEGLELALFMLSACAFDLLLYNPASPVLRWLPDATLRRFLMGCTMGGTAVLIIHSYMGKRYGAHFNPAITLTYLRLKKDRALGRVVLRCRPISWWCVRGVGRRLASR